MSNFSHIGLRPSLAPVVKQCPSAMYKDPNFPEIRLLSNEVFSATGSALHAVFKDIIYPGRPLTKEALEPYAERFQVTLDGYFGIHWRAAQVAEKWAKIAQWYQGARLEEKISCTLSNGFELEGTPDIHRVSGNIALVNDLKSGEKDFDYFAQVELYALIIWKRNAALGVTEVYGALFHPMLERYTNQRMTADRLQAVEEFYVDAMEKAGTKYVTGPMCQVCPRLLSCPAVLRSVDPTVAELKSGREITPADIRQVRPAIRYMKQMVERYEEVERVLVERFGTIDLGGGYELFLRTDMQDKLEPVQAFNMLTEEFKIPADKVLAGMNISKEAVKEAARAIAVPRDRERGLAKTQEKLLKALDERGAIREQPKTYVSTRPIQVALKEET